MHDAVDVVHVFLVEVLGGVHGDDRLERRRAPAGHLDRVEPTPGDAEHADAAVAPRLPGKPVDDRLAVLVLLVGVLVRDEPPLAVAGAADVDPRNHVAAFDEVRVEPEVAGAGLGLAVGQVLEDGRKALADPAPRRQVDVGRESDAVGHGDPRLAHLDPVPRRRRGRRGGTVIAAEQGDARGGERAQQDSEATGRADPRPTHGTAARSASGKVGAAVTLPSLRNTASPETVARGGIIPGSLLQRRLGSPAGSPTGRRPVRSGASRNVRIRITPSLTFAERELSINGEEQT